MRLIEELAGCSLARYHGYCHTATSLAAWCDVMGADWVTFHTVLLIELLLITWIKDGCKLVRVNYCLE